MFLPPAREKFLISQVKVFGSLVKGKISEWVLSATDGSSDTACFK